MAITSTKTLVRVEVAPRMDASATDTQNAKWPTVHVHYHYEFDDDSDNDLPQSSPVVVHLTRYEEDGGSATTVTSHDQLVQDICAAVWTAIE